MSDEFQAGFVRQRRSLVLISILISVVVGFGVKGTEVRVGPGGGTGLSVDLLQVRFIYWALYAVWTWSLLRYWQYFTQIRDKARNQLAEVQQPSIERIFRLIIVERAPRVFEGVVLAQNPGALHVNVSSVGVVGREKRVGWIRVFATVRAEVKFKPDEDSAFRVSKLTAEIDVRGFRLYPPLLKAITAVTIRHPYVTEYLVPFWISLLPLIALAFRWKDVFLPPHTAPPSFQFLI